jgi:hypothetical protein
MSSCGIDDKVVDWKPYYRVEKTEPFGLYVFNEEIEKIKPKFRDIERINRGVSYEYQKDFQEISEMRDHAPKTYVYIDEENKMNKQSRQDLMNYAYYGNHVFISTHNFDFEEFENDVFNYQPGLVYAEDTVITTFAFSGKKIKASSDRIRSHEYFEIIDTNWAIPLGYFQINTNTSVQFCNFMALRYGDGIVFLHSNPEVFTNYFLLQANNVEYLEELLSQWNFREVKWFVNYTFEFDDDYGLLTYMMNQPALKTAWYLLWFLLLIAVFTYTKRMQRVIPIVQEKRNYTVEYAKRLAQFHLLQKNYYGLIDKQIVIMLDKLRSEFRMEVSQIDDSFALKMHTATNCNLLAAEDFVRFIKKHRVRSQAFDFDFEELRTIINKLNL